MSHPLLPDAILAPSLDGFALGPSLSPSARQAPPLPTQASPATTSPGVDSARARESLLDALNQLEAVLADDGDYAAPTLDYALPAGFRLSVVVPVYNEKATILKLLARVYALPIPMQILVVDDCSTDGTRDVLRLLEGIAEVHCLCKPRNEGKGAALRTGFEHATGDVVIVQDADLEYDPRDIPSVIRPIVENRADVVYGSRFLQQTSRGSSSLHQFGNHLLTGVSNLTTGLRISDMETCYKAFRRSVLATVPLRQNRFGFEPEVTAKIARRRLRLAEVPIRYHAREWTEGKKIGWRDAVNALYCIARYSVAD